MNVVDMRLDQLKPYENNPRHNDEAVDYVANSIERFGFKVPLVVDKDGTIVTGHTRYKAARQLGLDTVPVIVADDLTEDQIKAFRLADNKVAEIATWDSEALQIELDDLSDLDIDMGEFGFSLDLFQSDEDEIEDMNVDGVESKESSIGKLSINGKNYTVADDEARLFIDRIEEWIADTGLAYGFLRSILND